MDNFTTDYLNMWSKGLQPYLPSMYGVAGILVLLLLTAVLWRFAWLKRGREDGMPIIYGILGALPLVGVLYLMMWIHIDLMKGLLGLFGVLAIVPASMPRKSKRTRRHRY